MAFWLVVPFLWPLFFFGSRGLFCASFALWFSAGEDGGTRGIFDWCNGDVAGIRSFHVGRVGFSLILISAVRSSVLGLGPTGVLNCC